MEALTRALTLSAIAFLLVFVLVARGGAARGGFRIDEAHKISESAFLRLWPHGSDPAWTMYIADRANPPVGKYLFAISILLAGQRIPPLPTLAAVSPDRAAAAFYPAEVMRRYEPYLPAARRVATVCMALIAALVAWCAARVGGVLGATVAVALLLTNYVTQLLWATAVFDPILTLFAMALLAIAAARPRVATLILLGAIGALAFQTRLNGALFFVVTLAVVLPRARLRALWSLLAFAVVTLAVNPYYWPNPPARLAAQLHDARVLLAEAPAPLTTLGAKWRFFFEVVGGDVAGLLLFLGAIGGAIALAVRWRTLEERERVIGVWSAATIAVFVVWLPVAWPRYLLATVPPLCCLAAIGCGALQRAAINSRVVRVGTSSIAPGSSSNCFTSPTSLTIQSVPCKAGRTPRVSDVTTAV